MKINFKDLVKAPAKEGYIKNSSTLVTGLFVIGGILYNLTKGYGTVVALGIALLVMVIQKISISILRKSGIQSRLLFLLLCMKPEKRIN
jgi:hypothetical protein